MLTNAQRMAILDELQVTRGMWPSMPDGEHAIRGYAEHLGGFSPEEIHAGFKLARLKAEHTYPKVAQVVACCNAVVSRRHVTWERPEGDDRVTPCCEGYVAWLEYPVLLRGGQNAFPDGRLVVDRFGIWHVAGCHRLEQRQRQEVAA